MVEVLGGKGGGGKGEEESFWNFPLYTRLRCYQPSLDVNLNFKHKVQLCSFLITHDNLSHAISSPWCSNTNKNLGNAVLLNSVQQNFCLSEFWALMGQWVVIWARAFNCWCETYQHSITLCHGNQQYSQ